MTKIVFLNFSVFHRLKYAVSILALREMLPYRYFCTAIYCFLFVVCNIIIIYQFVVFYEHPIFIILMLLKLGMCSFIIITKIREVLTYDGSSSYFYVKKLYSLYKYLPDIHCSVLKLIMTNPESILNECMTTLSITDCTDADIEWKSESTQYSHFDWGYIIDIPEEDRKHLKHFFFEELDNGEIAKESCIALCCFTQPFKKKYYMFCICSWLCWPCWCLSCICCPKKKKKVFQLKNLQEKLDEANFDIKTPKKSKSIKKKKKSNSIKTKKKGQAKHIVGHKEGFSSPGSEIVRHV